MASSAIVGFLIKTGPLGKNKSKAPEGSGTSRCFQLILVVLCDGFAFDHFAATVVTVGADVVAQMGFTGGRLNGQGAAAQGIVGTAHIALGTGFAVLLNCHEYLLG
jgi:hypothetical protein